MAGWGKIWRMALKVASTGPSPWQVAFRASPSISRASRASGSDVAAALDAEAEEPDPLLGRHDALVDQGHDVLVEDLLLLVGQGLEADEGIVERIVADVVAQLLQLLLEGMPAGMLAHDEVGAEEADILGPHDLVGLGVLEHAVLVDAALMGEGVRTHDRLVGLDLEAGDGGDEARGLHDLLGDDAGPEGQAVGAHVHRHHHLFKRAVARPLADAVDRALDLPRTGLDRAQGVGHGEAQIVVAVDRDHRLVDVGHVVPDLADEVGELLGIGIAHRVRDVDGGGTSLNGALDAAEEEVGLGARGIHAAPLDIVGVAPGAGDALDHALVDLLGIELELVLAMQRRGADEGVDALAFRGLERFAGAVDIALRGAGEPADHALLHALRDLVHGAEVALRRDREAGLDHVDAHAFQHLGDADLLLDVHRAAGGLLAVARAWCRR